MKRKFDHVSLEHPADIGKVVGDPIQVADSAQQQRVVRIVVHVDDCEPAGAVQRQQFDVARSFTGNIRIDDFQALLERGGLLA